jgi:elongation factor G
MRGIKGWMPSKHFGELSFFRIYSGQITTGDDLFNASRNITERIGQIFLLNGRTRETVSRLGAGDIGATVKPKNTHTGDTLCAPNHPVKLPVPEYPHPNIHAALQPRAMGEEDKVAAGWRLCATKFSPAVASWTSRRILTTASCTL